MSHLISIQPGDRLQLVDRESNTLIYTTPGVSEIRGEQDQKVLVFENPFLLEGVHSNEFKVNSEALKKIDIRLYSSEVFNKIKDKKVCVGDRLQVGGPRITKFEHEISLTVEFEYGPALEMSYLTPKLWPFIPEEGQRLRRYYSDDTYDVRVVKEVDLGTSEISWIPGVGEGDREYLTTNFSYNSWKQGDQFSLHIDNPYAVEREVILYSRPQQAEEGCTGCSSVSTKETQEPDLSILSGVGMSDKEYKLHLVKNGWRPKDGI